MSLGDVIAVLGAGTAGFMRGRQMKREQDKEDADLKWQQEQRDHERQQWQRDDQTRADVTAAGAPVTMAQSGGKPDTMDNSDVGQPGEAPVAPNAFNVAGKTFEDQGQAQAALADANTPHAAMSRMADAYMKNGQGGMAAQVRAAGLAAEASQLGLDATKAKMANELFDQGLTSLMDHNAIADYVSNSRGDGQGGAIKVKAVPSADGKTVTYNLLNPDGTLAPTGQTYDNTPGGVANAKMWLSKATPLQQKIVDLHQQDELKRQVEKDRQDAEFRGKQLGIEDAKARAELAHYHVMEVLAGGRTAASANKAASKFTRMDEDTKLQYQGLSKTEQEISGKIDQGVAAGTLDPKSDGFAMLQTRLIQAKQARIGFEMRYGLIEPDDIATSITEGEKDPAVITKGVQQAYQLGGKAFGDAVKAKAQPAIDALVKAGATAPGGGAPAPAPRGGMAAAAAAAAPPPFVPERNASMERVEAPAMQRLQVLKGQLDQANAQLRAAGQSGDQKAIALYAQRVNDASAALNRAAEESFGNGAEARVASLK